MSSLTRGTLQVDWARDGDNAVDSTLSESWRDILDVSDIQPFLSSANPPATSERNFTVKDFPNFYENLIALFVISKNVQRLLLRICTG